MECYGGGLRHTLSTQCVKDGHQGAAEELMLEKLEKQRICAHEHVLPPSRWDPHAMCIDCGKSL